MNIIKISLLKLYIRYKPYYETLKKYYGKEEPILWFGNHPISIFARDYVEQGNKILDNLDNHVFILYEYERYKDSVFVKNDTHKYIASKRIINIVDSIKRHGYCGGKYKNPRYMINVTCGFSSPYGKDKEGYTLHARKHRAAACLALGVNNVNVKVFK